MQIIHAVMTLIGILILLFGYVAGNLHEEGLVGLVKYIALKFSCLIGGIFFLCYGLYQLGYRIITL